jgi:secondary thiamine-phosphate synthase enzyme
MDIIEVASRHRRQLIDITSFVQQAVEASEVAEGVCHIFVPHTTAAPLVSENADPAVGDDVLAALEKMVPAIRFRHAEGNSDAHLFAALIGPGLVLPVSSGELMLGRWQAVFLLELDGPRQREVWITCLRA